MPRQTKICTKCKEDKSIQDFNLRTRNKDSLDSWCKLCSCKSAKRYRRNNPDIVKAMDRRKELKVKYGITPIIYDKLFESQNGVCAICRKAEKGKRLAVDHCHNLGKVRGLLCFRCNTKLAHLEDLDFVIKARIYLDESI